jgi:tRNA U38,U39,U40 pseudouridine synthase TruA
VQDGGLDLELMRAAAAQLVGDHDFRNFCKVGRGPGLAG